MGMSPHQYVVRRRIERAKYLLGYAQEPIAQIAHGCGFSHHAHLSGMFRRHVAETPARHQRRKRAAATRCGHRLLISQGNKEWHRDAIGSRTGWRRHAASSIGRRSVRERGVKKKEKA